MSKRAHWGGAGRFRRIVAWTLGLFLGLASEVRAEARLDSLFSSGAVLQQGRPIPIFGTADDGESITIGIQDFKVTTVAAGGQWKVEVGPLKPGGPFGLLMTGPRTNHTASVYVGEVWVCAGHSNMQWPVLSAANSSKLLYSPVNRDLRLFNVPRAGAIEPKASFDSFWLPAGSASISNFSAIGCFFANELQPKLNVPVGLVSCNHYSSNAEAWTSAASLAADPALKHLMQNVSRSTPEGQIPGRLFNGMVAPLARFAVRGVLWYQGESNIDRAYEYRKLFPLLIADWRKAWNEPDLPFLFVQLAPYKPSVVTPGDSRWAELRESQFLTWKSVPKTAMVVITDHGDQYNMHPREKEPVGKRLALAARALAYGEAIDYSGPAYTKYSIVNDKIVCEFDHVGGGLEFKGDKPLGFAIAGRDKKFIAATAEIEGNTVVVRHESISAPEAVRYGWADYPTGNLYNAAGLPASPFRTDNYPLTTVYAPKPVE